METDLKHLMQGHFQEAVKIVNRVIERFSLERNVPRTYIEIPADNADISR